MALSSETLDDATLDGRPFLVGPKHRFAHAVDYILGLLAQHALAPLEVRPITVRYDEGTPVPGHLILARKAP